jgi:hypothetical protein
MVGSKTGLLVGHLKRAFLHCIINQEALCGKIMKNESDHEHGG